MSQINNLYDYKINNDTWHVVTFSIQAQKKFRQEDQEFKAYLSYTVNSTLYSETFLIK